jgi:hypothetical protein
VRSEDNDDALDVCRLGRLEHVVEERRAPELGELLPAAEARPCVRREDHPADRVRA